MTTSDPTTPALLSAARLEEIRERDDSYEACPFDMRAPITDDELRALLAHLDALTAPAPADGGEALGLRLRASLRGLLPAWLSEEQKATITDAALALHAIGYAAGRSEGEAERAAERARFEDDAAIERDDADAEIARLTAELAAPIGCLDHSCAVAPPQGMGTAGRCRCDERTLRRAVREMRSKIDAMAVELAAAEKLTADAVDTSAADRERALDAEQERDAMAAELAEARGSAKRWASLAERNGEDAIAHAARAAAARRDGAREEREAIRDKVDHDARFGADSARGPMLAIVDWLDSRARGEGQGS